MFKKKIFSHHIIMCVESKSILFFWSSNLDFRYICSIKSKLADFPDDIAFIFYQS